MRPLPRHLVPALAACVALTGCAGGGGDDIARLEEDLDTQARAQTTLRERMIELEDRLAAATAPGDDPALTALGERIDELEGRVDDLTRRLEEAATAREDEQAEVLAALASLESSLTELRGILDEFETGQVRLREDLTLLERRFENHDH